MWNRILLFTSLNFASITNIHWNKAFNTFHKTIDWIECRFNISVRFLNTNQKKKQIKFEKKFNSMKIYTIFFQRHFISDAPPVRINHILYCSNIFQFRLILFFTNYGNKNALAYWNGQRQRFEQSRKEEGEKNGIFQRDKRVRPILKVRRSCQSFFFLKVILKRRRVR